MSRTTVKYIKPETICIGDTIKVSHDHKDTIVSVQGTVARREIWRHSTEYYTAEGQSLLVFWRYQKNNFRVTLIHRASNWTPELFDMENI